MIVLKEASIHNGSELIEKHHKVLNEEIYKIIEEIEVNSLKRITKYLIHEEFRKHEFFSEHNVEKFSYEENFIKDKVMINIRCESSIESDIAKLDYFFKQGLVEAAVEILPNYKDPVDLSHADIFDKIIENLQNKFPKVPIKLLLVDTVEER